MAEVGAKMRPHTHHQGPKTPEVPLAPLFALVLPGRRTVSAQTPLPERAQAPGLNSKPSTQLCKARTRPHPTSSWALGPTGNSSCETPPIPNASGLCQWDQNTDVVATAFPFRPSSFRCSVDAALESGGWSRRPSSQWGGEGLAGVA